MMNRYTYGNNGYDMMGYNSSFLGDFLIIMFVLIIGITVFLMVNNNIKSNKRSNLDILNIKYANGEISREEYLETKNILRKS